MNSVLCVVLVTIVALITISFFFEFNIGPLAVLVALVIGKVFMGVGPGSLVGMIPGSTILTLILLSAFYGFALENGTANVLIQRMLNRFGRKMALFPVGMFALTAVLSGIGLGSGNATMIAAPIALAIAAEADIAPLVMAAAVGCGAAVGSNFPFSFGGLVAATLIEGSGELNNATPAIMDAALRGALIQGLSFLVVFLQQKGYRNSGMEQKAVPDMTPVQKKTAALIGVVVAVSVLPPVADMLLQSPMTSALAGYCDINTVMLVGIVVAMLMRLGDERVIIKNHVPWMLIVVISGMSMLIGLAKENGIVQLLGSAMSQNLPLFSIQYVLLLIGMVMSLFGGAISIVIPTLYPMVPGIAAATGLDIGQLYGCVLVGATCGGLSPYSSGGMILMSAYPSDRHRREFMLGLLCMPPLQSVISMLVYAIW